MHGIVGALVGCIVLGMMMGMMGMLPSLYGHLIFGVITGFVFHRGENCFLVPNRRGSRLDDGDNPEPSRLEVV